MKLLVPGNGTIPRISLAYKRGTFRRPTADFASCFAARSLISGNAELETCRNPIQLCAELTALKFCCMLGALSSAEGIGN